MTTAERRMVLCDKCFRLVTEAADQPHKCVTQDRLAGIICGLVPDEQYERLAIAVCDLVGAPDDAQEWADGFAAGAALRKSIGWANDAARAAAEIERKHEMANIMREQEIRSDERMRLDEWKRKQQQWLDTRRKDWESKAAAKGRRAEFRRLMSLPPADLWALWQEVNRDGASPATTV